MLNSIIVEGPSGVGKTTIIKALAARLGWPIYRPFRNSLSSHLPGDSEPGLKTLGVPVNTWMEDLFTADLLATVKPNVILDRSMPSALAYEALGFGTGLHPQDRLLAIELWARRINAAGGLIVKLTADVETCVERSGRLDATHIREEALQISSYVNLAWPWGVKVCDIRTDRGVSTDFHLSSILRSLGR